MLKTVRINRDDLNELIQDRIDFGFDSIYFRYATVRDNLACLRAREGHNLEIELKRAEKDKMRFYAILEQYTHAHASEKDNEK